MTVRMPTPNVMGNGRADKGAAATESAAGAGAAASIPGLSDEFVGMLFFHGKDGLQHESRCRDFDVEVLGNVSIAEDGNTFRQLIGVALSLVRAHWEFSGNAFQLTALDHEMMTPI